MQSSYLCFHYVLCEKRGWKYYITPPPLPRGDSMTLWVGVYHLDAGSCCTKPIIRQNVSIWHNIEFD